MVQRMKTVLLAWLLGAIFVSTSLAQNISVQLIAVGDGVQFNTWVLTAHAASAAGNNYTISGYIPGALIPYAAMLDTRLAGIPLEEGELWVVWNNAPITQVWCFLAVNSGVATRGFFAAPRTRLQLNPAVKATPGQNLVPGLPPDAPALPAAVFNAINLASWNAAMTGTTPAEALAENVKILAVPPAPPARYGYGPAPIKLSIFSTVAPTMRTPVAYDIAGADPITGVAIPASITTALRKSLVIPFVNATNVAPPGGIGSFIAANHNHG